MTGLNLGLAAVALSIVLAGPALAAGNAKGYDCRFSEGATWSLEDGAFKPEAPGSLSFRIAGLSEGTDKAKLEEGSSASEIKVVEAIGARHFIEVAVEGYLNLTTIYEGVEGAAKPAVHSRHLAVLGQPVVSQYRGWCTPTE